MDVEQSSSTESPSLSWPLTLSFSLSSLEITITEEFI